MNITKMYDYAIHRLKELQLCINEQKDLEITINDSSIIVNIICDEIEEIYYNKENKK